VTLLSFQELASLSPRAAPGSPRRLPGRAGGGQGWLHPRTRNRRWGRPCGAARRVRGESCHSCAICSEFPPPGCGIVTLSPRPGQPPPRPAATRATPRCFGLSLAPAVPAWTGGARRCCPERGEPPLMFRSRGRTAFVTGTVPQRAAERCPRLCCHRSHHASRLPCPGKPWLSQVGAEGEQCPSHPSEGHSGQVLRRVMGRRGESALGVRFAGGTLSQKQSAKHRSRTGGKASIAVNFNFNCC